MKFILKTSSQFFLAILLVGFIGIIDFITGYQISFSIFYLIPIMWIAWVIGRKHGIIIACLSAIVWYEADILAQHIYSHPVIPIWNAFMRFTVFIIIVVVLSALKNALEREKRFARLDHLTQVANFRSFVDKLEAEIVRSRRYQHVFSLAYLDLDNFKIVNDKFGHEEGNKLLQETASLIQKEIRKTDLLGRLGGDEFAILMPETDQTSAREVLNRIKAKFMLEMQKKNYPVSMSIGCITVYDASATADDIIKKADSLMYMVKSSSKDDLICDELRPLQTEVRKISD